MSELAEIENLKKLKSTYLQVRVSYYDRKMVKETTRLFNEHHGTNHDMSSLCRFLFERENEKLLSAI